LVVYKTAMASSVSAPIAPVMFKCARKGGPVSTGHRMRPAEFAAVVGPRSFRCAACDEVHTWTAETAWLHVRPAA